MAEVVPQLAINIEHVMHVTVNGVSTHIPVRHDDEEGGEHESSEKNVCSTHREEMPSPRGRQAVGQAAFQRALHVTQKTVCACKR